MEPTTVEQIFADFKGRRAGLLKALTTDADNFHQQCDPAEDPLCLFGLPDETWEVRPPVEYVPSLLPEPVLGINFARGDVQNKNLWLRHVALHSDSWLLALAFTFGQKLGNNERERLFEMMNELPTLLEVVPGRVELPRAKSVNHNSNNKSSGKSRHSMPQPSAVNMTFPTMVEDASAAKQGEDYDQQSNICEACGRQYASGEFWISCDICKRWFHGICVGITPSAAEDIEQYECPGCSITIARGLSYFL